MRITPHRVPCPVCKVEAGRSCIFVVYEPKLGKHMSTCHSQRRDDAQVAERMANTLLDVA
jgi:hypothetical protein